MTTPENPPPDQERVDALIRAATELNNQVVQVAQESGTQFVSLARAAKMNRMLIWLIAGAGALLTLVTLVMIFLWLGVRENTDRIDKVATQTSVVQTVQRQRALCPLYGVFLDSKSEQGRKNAPDPEKYDHAFEVIEEGYRVLECGQYLKESGRDQW